MDQHEAHEQSNKSPRKAGLGALLASVICAVIFIVWPIIQAQRQVPEITTYMTGVAATIIFLLIGLILLIFGKKAVGLLTFDSQNLRGSQVAILLLLAAIGIALFFVVMAFLSKLGYT